MILLVCGSRDYTNRRIMKQVIEKYEPDTIIHGGYRGADEMAHSIADELDIYVQVFKADWDKYGNSAGPIRNKKMLTEGQPDLVMAFFDGKRSKGTNGMIKLARAALVPVVEYGLGKK